MDLQADIKWITKEIQTLKDPELVEAFKQMLRFRKKVQTQSHEDYNRDIELAEDDIKEDRLYTHEQVKDLKNQWKQEL